MVSRSAIPGAPTYLHIGNTLIRVDTIVSVEVYDLNEGMPGDPLPTVRINLLDGAMITLLRDEGIAFWHVFREITRDNTRSIERAVQP